jgi:hypothetical protein
MAIVNFALELILQYLSDFWLKPKFTFKNLFFDLLCSGEKYCRFNPKTNKNDEQQAEKNRSNLL